jgi:fumarylacetoacetase
MNPLGPMNGKNFGTSISPWIITTEALEPFKVPSQPHEKHLASYLADPNGSTYAVELQVELISGGSSTTTCRSSLRTLYWTFHQMLAHHTIGGCDLRTGDILASGTCSGPGESERGCLAESTWGGSKALKMEDGSSRTFLQDGDIVRITAKGAVDGVASVGFGECVAEVLPARPLEKLGVASTASSC